MHDHTSKGLKQLAVMKISNMISRYCITYPHYNIYFSHIFLLCHENSTPLARSRVVWTPPVNPSLYTFKIINYKKYLHYLMSVLTLATSTSYNFLTAPLIFGLLARTSTINTRVLLSSIFFIADSVVSGCLMIANWSSLFVRGIDTRGYFGCRGNFKVLGRWNCTDVRTFRFAVDFTPLRTAFLALFAVFFSAAFAPPLPF